MPKVKPRFGPMVIAEYRERGESLVAAMMEQINEAELAGLRLAGELEALAERICYLIGTGQAATDQDESTIAIDRTTRHLLVLHEIRIRRSMAYGNLILALGPDETADLLNKHQPIDITEHHGLER